MVTASSSYFRALAIETSGQAGSVALAEDGKVLVEEQFAHGLKHAAGILPMIDRLMRQLHWNPADLQHLYVSQGPGSFTGLRIGITLVKTLAFATGAKIVAVPTLQVLAENAPEAAGHLIILLDAKRDQIFTARYERALNRWNQIEAAHLDSLTAMIERSPRPVHLLGEGIPYHKHFLPPDAPGIFMTEPDRWRARASVVARIGMELAATGAFVSPDQLIPAYIRRPEAEEKYELEHGHGR